MDPLASAAEVATILQLAATAPMVQRRGGHRVSIDELRRTYTSFGGAALNARLWVNHLVTLDETRPRTLDTALVGMFLVGRLESWLPGPAHLLRDGGLERLAELRVSSDFAGEVAYRGTLIGALAGMRETVAKLLEAYTATRAVARPEVAECAERLLTSLGSVLTTVPSGRPDPRLGALGEALPQGRRWLQRRAAYGDAVSEFDQRHGDFTRAVGAELRSRRGWRLRG